MESTTPRRYFVVRAGSSPRTPPYAGRACSEAGVPAGAYFETFAAAKATADSLNATSEAPGAFEVRTLVLPGLPLQAAD